MPHFVYILASRPGGALYVGSTMDLRRRVDQHRAEAFGGHTAKYGIKTLVWFEVHESPVDAFARERSIKRWLRTWKDQLIMEANPNWQDITAQIPY